ncbi:MAG: radical SAM family heme chaperone HemW [Bryobacter sp.]|nr:radical SAM family heme chaperone HemW [Bryobacter sp.]
MPGVYISYPFCAQKCTYCNFASGVFPAELEPKYQAKLREEIQKTAWPWVPQTIYLGGGTPSLWPVDDLALTLATIPGHSVAGQLWQEATIECAPGTLSPAKLAAWRAAGLNRISLGVQSFVETELRRTGRKHTAETVAQDVALLRAAGFANFNLDLIVGLAGQTRGSWEHSLASTLALRPPHISIYLLDVDEDSRLGAEVLLNGQRYGARDIPSDADQADFFEWAIGQLAAAGYVHYEISNFALPGAESRHNLKYWELEEYLGFGADAHSQAHGQRWQNAESPADYVQEGEARREAEPANHARERFWVGLRLLGGIAYAGEFPEVVQPLLDDGLLELEHARLRLSRRGLLLANEVFARFLPDV